MRICAKCLIEKSFSEFGPRARGANGLNSRCYECCRAKAAELRVKNPEAHRRARIKWVSKDKENISTLRTRLWRLANPERNRYVYKKAYLKKYGLTPEKFDDMVAAQGGKCALCPSGNTGKSLCVDHDHFSGDVRALLCDRCNTVLGLVGENNDLMNRMILYLEYYGELQKKKTAQIR